MYGRVAMPAPRPRLQYFRISGGAGTEARPYVLFDWDFAGYNSEN